MTVQFTVPDMACSACSDTITKALKSLDPNANVTADPKTKLVTVDTQQSETAVKEAVTAAGYTVSA
ncbi:heavy-metal-associated domain-containing protein [Leptolyngbya sp. AN02str]|uniref:heavy-metal-associated domain-containing protein n=1 Tax=Leptolyngbya sp. AN02str TaxID=3423363 RepID=UPI003D31472B